MTMDFLGMTVLGTDFVHGIALIVVSVTMIKALVHATLGFLGIGVNLRHLVQTIAPMTTQRVYTEFALLATVSAIRAFKARIARSLLSTAANTTAQKMGSARSGRASATVAGVARTAPHRCRATQNVLRITGSAHWENASASRAGRARNAAPKFRCPVRATAAAPPATEASARSVSASVCWAGRARVAPKRILKSVPETVQGMANARWETASALPAGWAKTVTSLTRR